jgi:hypothetical protein
MSLFYARVIQAIQRHCPSILHEEGGGVDWASGIGRRREGGSLRNILGREEFRGTGDSSASKGKPGVCHPHADGLSRKDGEAITQQPRTRRGRDCRRRKQTNFCEGAREQQIELAVGEFAMLQPRHRILAWTGILAGSGEDGRL